MKNICLALIMVVTTLSSVAQTTWKVKPGKSEIHFAIAGDEGTLSDLQAEITFDPMDLTSTKMSAVIPVSTINTNNKKRDAHLKSADFFDAEVYPNITFVSSNIEQSEKGYVVTGKLKIKDIEKEEKIAFTFEDNVFAGDLIIYTGDYGIRGNKSKEDQKTTITIKVPVNKK